MDDIQKKELIDFLRTNMSIELEQVYEWGVKGIRAIIFVDDIEIRSNVLQIESNYDPY